MSIRKLVSLIFNTDSSTLVLLEGLTMLLFSPLKLKQEKEVSTQNLNKVKIKAVFVCFLISFCLLNGLHK